MVKLKRKRNKGKQTEKDCALTAEVFGLCCNRCEDLLVSITGNRPVGHFLGIKESIFDRSALLSETTVEVALSCFRPVVLKTIAKNPSLVKKARFNGHDALFYIQGLKILWQTTFSALKRTLSAPKCLIVSEQAISKAFAEIEHLYKNGEKRYSIKDVQCAFQCFLKTLPDLATALAQHDYKDPIGGVGSRAVHGEWMTPDTTKVSENPTERETLSRPVKKKQNSNAELECSISNKTYEDILTIIKNTAMTWECTSNSYRHMGEEALRDVLLGSLSGCFPGKANGETFRKNGKTDICIEAEDRTAFVAECKIWKGKRNVHVALAQLDSYLTWRDCKTALIFFVKCKNFLSVVDKMLAVLNEQKNLQKVRAMNRNEFVCQMPSIHTPGHMITIRVLLFNLHSYADNKGASKRGAMKRQSKDR